MYEEQNNQQFTPAPQPQGKKPADGKSIAGLVLGILSVILFFIGFATFWTWLVGLVMSIVSIILSALGYKEGKNGCAIAGLVLSIIALVLNAILFISCGLCVYLIVA